MAIGSRRTPSFRPMAAAVVSEPMVAPMYTPWLQLNASRTSGTVVERRPPKRMAEIGTPLGSSTEAERAGLLRAGAVKRLLGWAIFSEEPFFQGWPFQSVHSAGASLSIPSHQMSPAWVRPTLVKKESFFTVSMALGLVLRFVPGATPK